MLGASSGASAAGGATYTVNTTDAVDDGVCGAHCSLLDARDAADANPGPDTIAFNIPGSAPHVIQPSIGVEFGEPVDILGDTQPDSSPGHPTVVIDGSRMSGGTYGELQLDGGHSTVRRLVINGWQNAAIALEALTAANALLPPVGGNVVEGNFIGTDWTGSVAVPTGGGVVAPTHFIPPPGPQPCGEGCFGAPDNRIGGPDPSQRNVIATHFEGFPSPAIFLQSSGNTVQGNFIGTDVSGDHALVPPTSGEPAVFILGDGNLVGGTTGVTPGGRCTGACNVVTAGGVQLHGSDNTVQGNLIGTDATGTKSLGSATGDYGGVAILPLDRAGLDCPHAVRNRVGGTDPGAGNVIAGAHIGIYVSGKFNFGPETCGPLPTENHVEGNLVGTDVTGTKTTDADGRSFGSDLGVFDVLGSGDVIGGTAGTTPGGPCTGACNLISGNAFDGVSLVSSPFLCGCGNIVQGNLIGTDITGTQDLGNGTDGIQAGDANSESLRDTVIADNVVSGNGWRGLFVAAGSAQRVVGNKIGTDAAGTAAIPNDLDGLVWFVGVDGVIGGPTAGERNVVSGNGGSGIIVSPFSGPVRILNNYVGTDVGGTARLANGGDGIQIASAVQLGAPGAGNLISGNGMNGVWVTAAGSASTTIQGNKIGVTRDGAATLGNTGSGIFLAGATDVHVGGTGAGEGNVIAGNGADGVSVGFGTFPDPILGNSIFANRDLGIDLIGYLDDGVTFNDLGDGDTGANMQQNFPVITGSSGTTIAGTLNSLPGDYRIEVFSNPGVNQCDSSGYGEGETFLGAVPLHITDSQANTPFSLTVPTPVPAGAALTATATDPDGNTSEFSLCGTPTAEGQIVVQKTTRPAGSTQSFTFTPSYPGSFSLKDGEKNESDLLAPGTYSVSETPVSGWDSSASCDDGSPVTNISVSAGETVTCTFVNTQRATVTVTKSCPTGAAAPGDRFQVTSNGLAVGDPLACGGSLEVSVTGGSAYALDEQAAGTTNLANFTKQLSAGCAGTLSPGGSAGCTITNTLKPSTVTVTKSCPSGVAALGDRFQLTSNGQPVGDPLACGDSLNVTVTAGSTYTIDEQAAGTTILANYSKQRSGGCAGTLGIGGSAGCTITNTLKPGAASVRKTIAGKAPSGSQSFAFELRQGASTSSTGTILESGAATAGNRGIITFTTKLVPGTTYALCETVMPGWTTTLGAPFYVVYNPSGDNSTVCTDFSVQPGETKSFAVDNKPPPGGLARTIGFWKNWSSCASSKGSQRPVLDQTLAAAEPAGVPVGTLTLHGSTSTPNTAPDCLKAVRLLDKSTIDTGKKMASDPAFNLAAQLLAARLNVAAGAGTCPATVNALNDAQTLLAAVHFNGVTHDKLSGAQSTQATTLATTLDRYNNNQLC
jgi:hypothetical protein